MMRSLPSLPVAFKVLLLVNLCSAIWNTIGDCDETYNYWEPLHFLLYGKGFQTWEYSPVYALRSYAYLWFYGFIPNLLTILHLPKLLIFFIVRAQCCAVMSLCQLYLYFVLKRRSNDPVLVTFTMAISCASCGSFIASSAFLPSSFAMYCGYVMLAAWLDKKYKLAVSAVAISAIVGWPFSAALGLPLVFDLIFLQKKLVSYFAMSIVTGACITLPLLMIDSIYFGRLVIAPINILKYNVFSAHGSELYGVEPPSFYVFNYLLNFNIAAPLAFALPLIGPFAYLITREVTRVKLCLFAAPFFVWNIIFFLQAHKEERFLFPCYPFLCLAAGLAISNIAAIFDKAAKWTRLMVPAKPTFFLAVLLIFTVLSLSRILLIVVSFRAPLTAYSFLALTNASSQVKPQHVCVGKEWYRFPSHFLLNAGQELHFLKSEFKGQLPAKYSSGDWQAATRVIHRHFNDLNREEPSRYVPLEHCDFIVDRDEPSKSRWEPRYSQMKTITKVFSAPFLDTTKSTGLFKSFYVPLLFGRKNSFMPYVVLKRDSTHDV